MDLEKLVVVLLCRGTFSFGQTVLAGTGVVFRLGLQLTSAGMMFLLSRGVYIQGIGCFSGLGDSLGLARRWEVFLWGMF